MFAPCFLRTGTADGMDWALARERHLAALLRVLAFVSGVLGLSGDRSVTVVPRHVHSWVLRILRPAESALRRLIVIEARELRVAPPVKRAAAVRGVVSRGAVTAVPGFAIVEPLQRVAPARPPVAKGYGPRISFFDGFDEAREAPALVLPDDPVDAGRLCKRVLSAQAALSDLPKQALRLARWYARRDAGMLRAVRTRALRPGRPPGHRQRRMHEIDEVLANCHALALYALAPAPEP